MKQIAESICSIKKDMTNSIYYIKFDNSEFYETLTLDESSYKNLIFYRDHLNTVCVYDLFQEKIHSYYTPNPNHNKSHQHKKEIYNIAKRVQYDYDYCHHCKQRKPSEVMIQCRSHGLKEIKKRPFKVFNINGTTIVRKNKSLIIKDYEGSAEEFITATERSEDGYQCRRMFCNFCLKGSYDTKIEDVKDKKDWICPYCTGACFCSRCTRNDKMLKLIGLYISLEGDINILHDELILRNPILDDLHSNILVSNLVVMQNDPKLTPTQIVKKLILVDNPDEKKLEGMIKSYEEYKESMTYMKNYFNDLFVKARIDKCLLTYENEIMNKKVDKDNFIGKKRKSKCKVANNYFLKGPLSQEEKEENEHHQEEKKNIKVTKVCLQEVSKKSK